jgi:hypothetical protein
MGGNGATMPETAGAGVIVWPRSAFTKFRSTCVWQFPVAGFVRWQHPWAGWCDCKASSTCGQEKQFPQNSAATTIAAITELEKVRILSFSLTRRRCEIQQILRLFYLFWGGDTRVSLFGAPLGATSKKAPRRISARQARVPAPRVECQSPFVYP